MTENDKHLIKSVTGAITGFQRDILITTADVPGGRPILRTIGLVRGNSVRARHVGLDILAVLRNIVGGEVREYTKLMAESREHALDRMGEQAALLGANAVVGLRFTTSMIMGGAAELLAYGTAVVVGESQGE
ncbi:MAG: YbjQ family protein [Deltaproteobacteria bacterium]|nr:MAG: YbjQ family protein [Deltaproteobacteria bacterium]